MEGATYRAFFDELEKISSSKKDPTKLTAGEKAGLGVGGYLGASMAGGIGNKALSQSLQRDAARDALRGIHTDEEMMSALTRKIAPGSKFRMSEGGVESAMHIPRGGIMPGPLRKLEEAQYAARGLPRDVVEEGMKHGLSYAPRKAGAHIGAHELGHAAFGQKRIGRAIRKLRVPGMIGTMAAPIMAAASDTGSTTEKMAPVVGLAGALPVLGEEAYASLKGYKGMKQLGRHSPQALKSARRQLMKAWGTYGLGLGAAGVAAPLAIMGLKRLRKREKQQEQEDLRA